jgi:hypothetical protein
MRRLTAFLALAALLIECNAVAGPKITRTGATLPNRGPAASAKTPGLDGSGTGELPFKGAQYPGVSPNVETPALEILRAPAKIHQAHGEIGMLDPLGIGAVQGMAAVSARAFDGAQSIAGKALVLGLKA